MTFADLSSEPERQPQGARRPSQQVAKHHPTHTCGRKAGHSESEALEED